MFTGRLMTGRCRVFCSRKNAITANGMPMKKQPRQPSAESTTRPPMSGPPTVATANVAPM